LVILDMIMPVMSGSQVLKALREINPEVRIILSSGYVMQGNAIKVLEYEYSNFMQKPYSLIDLSRIVHEALV
ncbi:MAG TPA: response regulator, partial [Spirochaetota bacterium]|nr:response regulator [Spirochaetota bacterium]